MKTILILTLTIFSFSFLRGADLTAKVISVKGDVKVRHAMDETWQKAAIGLILKDIDTILSGEDSEVILLIDDKKRFILGSNMILDIADLRKIQDKELFLYLMSKKVENINTGNQKQPLRVGKVSTVHGSQKGTDEDSEAPTPHNWSVQEINGAIALHSQSYYANSIIKLDKVLEKYQELNKGKVHFYMAKSFEALTKNGQARDAYKQAIKSFEAQEQKNSLDTNLLKDAHSALSRLKEIIK